MPTAAAVGLVSGKAERMPRGTRAREEGSEGREGVGRNERDVVVSKGKFAEQPNCLGEIEIAFL